MKNLIKVLFAFIATLSVASFASAQYAPVVDENTGSGTLTFVVGKSVDLRNAAGYTQNIANTVSVTNTGAYQPLSFAVNFGDVSTNMSTSGLTSVAPGAAHPLIEANVGIQIRSNTGYQLSVSRDSGIAPQDSDPSTFDAGDVGVTISPSICSNLGDCTNVESGAKAGFDGGRIPGLASTDANGGFNAYTNVNGYANFGTQTLNAIGAPTPIVTSGAAISNGGDNSTSNNAIDFKMRFAVKPEYFTNAGVAGGPAIVETLVYSIVPQP